MVYGVLQPQGSICASFTPRDFCHHRAIISNPTEAFHFSSNAPDEHTVTLYVYFVVFNDLQYLSDLQQHYTMRTLLWDVFRATGNLHNVILTISDILQCFYLIFNVSLLISDLSLHQCTIYAFPQALFLAHQPQYTLFYCVPSFIYHFSSHFIDFAPISLNLLLQTLDYIYKPIQSFMTIYPITF